ncbi:MAG TPA: nuclear transport factor 2 family protein [Deltaproteobacteria bacterium]|nr:nuclear transport factor 2 family protein [Deltaproteobacteria bacterium]HPR55043.1 nuclear transport factor 2 family protein [Deltaproteobacteria bacterium]HXK47880.1 nuclear transport factor 2 family protein [Deltaproteobacteria bacterium]
MITQQSAERFAREWIEAWNSHDLDRILVHYSDDFALTTPYIAEFLKEPSGAVKGKKAAEEYWKNALRRAPDLHFELIEVLASIRSVVILYRTVFGRHAAEWMLFGDDGKVKRAIIHYV